MSFIEHIKKIKKKKESEKKVKEVKKIALATTIGSAIGAVTGILFAPKAGKETRKDIADNVKKASESVCDTVNSSVEGLKEKTAVVQKGLKDVLENVNESFTKLKGNKVEDEGVDQEKQVDEEE